MFKHRLVRDLAWVIQSPPLMCGNSHRVAIDMPNDKTNKKSDDTSYVHWWNNEDCKQEYSDCLTLLKHLDDDPSPLITYFNDNNTKRLGHRFETLVAYWLTISPNFTLLAKNIQIIKQGHTFGEIDFIIKNNSSNKIIHLEVAVKFYLGTTPYKDPFRWFGTNTQDQLGKKFSHLKKHQTQLCTTHKDYLYTLGFDIDERQCFLKGRLFYPANTNESPAGTADSHLRGQWTRDTKMSKSKYSYYPVNKSYWLSELNADDINMTLLQKTLSEKKWPTCYVELDQSLTEQNRVFYLPRDFIFP